MQKKTSKHMSKDSNAYDFFGKVVIVGDSNVGKTCLIGRFYENSFATSHMTTVGIPFLLLIFLNRIRYRKKDENYRS